MSFFLGSIKLTDIWQFEILKILSGLAKIFHHAENQVFILLIQRNLSELVMKFE